MTTWKSETSFDRFGVMSYYYSIFFSAQNPLVSVMKIAALCHPRHHFYDQELKIVYAGTPLLIDKAIYASFVITKLIFALLLLLSNEVYLL